MIDAISGNISSIAGTGSDGYGYGWYGYGSGGIQVMEELPPMNFQEWPWTHLGMYT